jgi:hypothetical protein
MLAFVHIEKTAGTSTHRIFQRSFGSRYCPLDRWRPTDQVFDASDYRKLRWFYPRLRGMGGHWIKPFSNLREVIPEIRYFTFLREPLARTASHYQHQIQRMGRTDRFEDWIAMEVYRNFQTRKIVGSEDVNAAIEMLQREFVLVGLSARFDESMLMLRRCWRPETLDIRYESENVAADDGIKRRLLGDPATRALLEDANRADLRLYEWVATELYPSQQRAYGPRLEADIEAFRANNRVGWLDWRVRRAEWRRRYFYRPAVLAHQWLSGRSAARRDSRAWRAEGASPARPRPPRSGSTSPTVPDAPELAACGSARRRTSPLPERETAR